MQEARPVAAHEVGCGQEKTVLIERLGSGDDQKPERARPRQWCKHSFPPHRQNGSEVMLAGGVELL